MTSKRETTSRSQPYTSRNDVDALAMNLASGLTLKGKQKAVNAEDTRVAAMRMINANAVSKQLSALIDKPSSRLTMKLGDARKGLRTLREDGRSGVDVQRLAASRVRSACKAHCPQQGMSLKFLLCCIYISPALAQ